MRICFITELPQVQMGGAENQCYMIAERLASKGHEIHYVCYKATLGDRSSKLTIHEVRERASRSSVNHIISLFSTLKQADCEAYLQTCPRLATGLTAFFCKLNGKVFVYRAASLKDADLTFSMEYSWPKVSWWFKKLYSYGIKNADTIVCNSKRVAEKFRELVDSVIVIPNGYPINPIKKMPEKKQYILWVARLTKVKRPQLLIEIAKRLPHYRFIMVGKGDYKSLDFPENLQFLGFKPGEELEELYKRASVFINTSAIEGFPNTLIEAGIYYTPYISFYDPDDVIKKYNLGYAVKNVDEAVWAVTDLMEDASLRAKMGSNIRRYVEVNHDIEKTVKAYEELFKELIM